MGELELAPGISVPGLIIVAGYSVYQWFLANLLLRFQSRSKSSVRLYAVLLLALIPLATTKLLPLVSPFAEFGFLGISYITFRILDHVYMRFLIAAAKGKWFKNEQIASYIGYFLAFGLMGLWHGIELHFVIYGVYQACLLTLFDLFSHWNTAATLANWPVLAGRIDICDGPFVDQLTCRATDAVARLWT